MFLIKSNPESLLLNFDFRIFISSSVQRLCQCRKSLWIRLLENDYKKRCSFSNTFRTIPFEEDFTSLSSAYKNFHHHQLNPINHGSDYSALKLFTGFVNAAFMA